MLSLLQEGSLASPVPSVPHTWSLPLPQAVLFLCVLAVPTASMAWEQAELGEGCVCHSGHAHTPPTEMEFPVST